MKIERTLKSGPGRIVLCGPDPDRGGELVVAKRFLATGFLSGFLSGLRARLRARREHGMLVALHRAGVRVPRPLACGACEGGWEVRMEAIPGARSLADHLADPATIPTRGGLARRLGELLASAHLAGLAHPDLHLGNILVDEGGEAWLIDLHKARLQPPLPLKRIERDLQDAAAALREHLSAPLRQRMLLEWLRTLPPSHLPGLPSLRELAARLETRARGRRLAVVERGQRRWLRTSGVCDHVDDDGKVFLRRRGFHLESRVQLLDRKASLLVIDGLPPRDLRDLWLAAARLHEHHVPAAAPAFLSLGDDGRAAFTLPRGAVRITSPAEITPADLGLALGTLHDRGLDVPALGPSDICARTLDAPVVRPLPGLVPFDPRPGFHPLGRRFSAVAEATAADESFRSGYLMAFANQPHEGAALAREIVGPGR